jgi:homoserine O-succinyltransferase
MTLQFEKHSPVAELAVGATRLNEAAAVDRPSRAADGIITIGLINNMPDAALAATERQFMGLLKAGAGSHAVRLHCFSLPSIQRGASARRRVETRYADIDDLDRLAIDGLIVTGAEPNAATLRQEPFWHELTTLIDWARSHTRSTIWSCLAAHAVALHLDGVARQRLDTKCSGIYHCTRLAEHWLTDQLPSPIKVPHSRLNELPERDLEARGYQLLTSGGGAGADIFAKDVGSQFILFQGHPEYDALSLQHEYLRDVSRYLAFERATYPEIPTSYFDPETESLLAAFRDRASLDRRPALSAELPKLRVRDDIAAGAAASVLFRNWLGYLAGSTRASQPR